MNTVDEYITDVNYYLAAMGTDISYLDVIQAIDWEEEERVNNIDIHTIDELSDYEVYKKEDNLRDYL